MGYLVCAEELVVAAGCVYEEVFAPDGAAVRHGVPPDPLTHPHQEATCRLRLQQDLRVLPRDDTW